MLKWVISKPNADIKNKVVEKEFYGETFMLYLRNSVCIYFYEET